MGGVKHTAGPWVAGHHANHEHSCECTTILSEFYAGGIANIIVANGLSLSEGGNDGPPHEEAEANARLIAAAPELKGVAENFAINGPDDDGLIWLVLHGNGTTGKAMINLGRATGLAGQVALALEQDRHAAIAKATGETE